MAIYAAKFKNTAGGIDNVFFKTPTMAECAKLVEPQKGLIGIKYISENTEYLPQVRIGFGRANDLFLDIMDFAGIARDIAQRSQFDTKSKTRLEMSKEHFNVRLIADQIKEKLEGVYENLDLILGFTEEKIDMD